MNTRERNHCQDIYRELTPAGTGLCAVLGLVAEIIIMLAAGIDVVQVPVVVLTFIWLLAGILVSGVVFYVVDISGIIIDWLEEQNGQTL
ncbi:MAG: hypothetical protein LUH07_06700 [Lachnospiraceae bacterium]|nr:hypothetical protein [Lachnospiraceae bacterium]